jgi:hypothetical protein
LVSPVLVSNTFAVKSTGGTGVFNIVGANTNTDQTFTLPNNTGTMLTSASAIARSQLPAGSVLQVVSATKTDTFSRQSSSSDFGDITGLSVSITPTSATSKILIFAIVSGSAGTTQRCGIRLVRNSTVLESSMGNSAGSRTRASSSELASGTNDTITLSCNFLDSPNTTSATTYKVQGSAENAQTFYVNRGSGDSDDISVYRSASSITVMEIAA